MSDSLSLSIAQWWWGFWWRSAVRRKHNIWWGWPIVRRLWGVSRLLPFGIIDYRFMGDVFSCISCNEYAYTHITIIFWSMSKVEVEGLVVKMTQTSNQVAAHLVEGKLTYEDWKSLFFGKSYAHDCTLNNLFSHRKWIWWFSTTIGEHSWRR